MTPEQQSGKQKQHNWEPIHWGGTTPYSPLAFVFVCLFVCLFFVYVFPPQISLKKDMPRFTLPHSAPTRDRVLGQFNMGRYRNLECPESASNFFSQFGIFQICIMGLLALRAGEGCTSQNWK